MQWEHKKPCDAEPVDKFAPVVPLRNSMVGYVLNAKSILAYCRLTGRGCGHRRIRAIYYANNFVLQSMRQSGTSIERN